MMAGYHRPGAGGPGRRKVLVVEDDEELLNIVARTLASGGYDVIWARNGVDALKLLEEQDQQIALVITDVVLPGMSGPELVEKVSERHSMATAIYVSAYDEDEVRSHGVDLDTMAFLPKPYKPDDLLRMVSEAAGHTEAGLRMSDEPAQDDPAGRIPPGARVVVLRGEKREIGTVADNQGPAYLVRFDDGAEVWLDREGVERDNPSAGEWKATGEAEG